MENAINLSILIPLIPLGGAILIFALLISFTRTINRLTKPISYISIFSILLSAILTSFFLLNHFEETISIANYFNTFKDNNLAIHVNAFTEKIILIADLTTIFVITISLLKLPRREGYVLYIGNLSLVTSIIIFSIFLIDFKI